MAMETVTIGDASSVSGAGTATLEPVVDLGKIVYRGEKFFWRWAVYGLSFELQFHVGLGLSVGGERGLGCCCCFFFVVFCAARGRCHPYIALASWMPDATMSDLGFGEARMKSHGFVPPSVSKAAWRRRSVPARLRSLSRSVTEQKRLSSIRPLVVPL